MEVDRETITKKDTLTYPMANRELTFLMGDKIPVLMP